MTQPGTPGSQIPAHDLDALARRLRDTERRLSQLESNAIGPNGYVIGDRASIRTIDFDGTSFADPGTAGVYLASEAGVGRLIVNEIYLRDGIIGNDALTNPLESGVFSSDAPGDQAFTTTANTIVHTGTITRPAGFTKALVVVTAVLQGMNPNGGSDYLLGRAYINGNQGPRNFVTADPGVSIAVPCQHAVSLTGLATDVTVQVAGWSSVAAWPSSAFNDAALTGFVVFSR